MNILKQKVANSKLSHWRVGLNWT